MQPENVIRETLIYLHRYRNQKIVVKLGAEVIREVEKLEILNDILLLKQNKIHIIITHAQPELKPQNWISLANMGVVVDRESLNDIEQYLAIGKIPIIYCFGSEILSPDAVIAQVAVEISATKLVYATNRDGIFDERKNLIHQITIEEAENILTQELVTGGMRQKIEAAIMACKEGVSRVQIINGLRHGSLLKEIFTASGVGTMIYDGRNAYQLIRKARVSDIVPIVSILTQAQLATTIVFEDIASKINQFIVFDEDQLVRGCMLMRENLEFEVLKVEYLATSTPYDPAEVMRQLFQYMIDFASARRYLKYISIEAVKSDHWLGLAPWFSQMGFKKFKTNDWGWSQNYSSNKIWVKKI